MLRRPSYGGLLKNIGKIRETLFGNTGCPSEPVHAAAATSRAFTDIDVPYGVYQFSNGHSCIFRAETLMPLKLEDQPEVFLPSTVVKKTVVPDLLKTVWKYVHQEPADEFHMAYCNGPPRFARKSPACRKGYMLLINRKDPAVGYRDLMGIAPKIFDCVAEPTEGLLDIRTPLFFIQGIPEFRPLEGVAEMLTGRRKGKLPTFIKGIQSGKISALELIPEYFDRDKEMVRGFFEPAVRREPTAGDDTVHMDMIAEFLVPGMEDLDDAGDCTEPFFIAGEFEKCLGAASVQKRVEKLLVTEDQGIELMGKGKDHMIVRGIYDLRAPFIDPDLLVYRLAVRTAPVPAGVVMESQIPTVLALRDIDAKFPGLTV